MIDKSNSTKENTSVFSERLRQTRKDQELSQEELAHRANISTTMISECENDNKKPTITLAERLATALGVSLDYLCGLGPQRVYERSPVLAWFEAIKALRMTIKSVDNGEIVLTFKEIIDTENGIEISGREIKRFFEEYKNFQMVTDIYADTPDAKIIIDTAEKHLLNRFKNLPKLPPYDVVKNEKK